MTGEEVYKALLLLDAGLARRWDQATGRGKKKISERWVEGILRPVLKTGKITTNQAKALALLYLEEVEFFDPPDSTTPSSASIAFIGLLMDAEEASMFAAGADLATDDEKNIIVGDVGGSHTSKISFKSPATNASYVSSDYPPLQVLISTGQIKTLILRKQSPLPYSSMGEYNTKANRLVITDGISVNGRIFTTVHEATHAIQDWRNMPMKIKYSEVDAYIAGGTAALSRASLKEALVEGSCPPAFWEPITTLSTLVLKGQAFPGKPGYDDAYNAFVKILAKSSEYSKAAEQHLAQESKKRQRAESKMFISSAKVVDVINGLSKIL